MMYVIQTRPHEERYLLKNLRNAGISAYLPEEQMIIRRRGKWHIENKFIFSGYIFIDSDYSAELHQKIRRLDGFLHFLGEPSPLSENETEQIKWLCNNGKPVTISHYIEGECGITFIDGILSKAKFKILKMYPRQKRVKVSVSVNDRNFKVFLPAEKSEL